jgi:pimeloyl-ACP methyl ester carboxylesterase
LPLQRDYGSGDDGHAVGTDAGSSEDLPGLQACHVAFDRSSGSGEGAVDGAPHGALGAPAGLLAAAHDIGAWVAFSLALTYESQLRGVALLDAGVPGITLLETIPTDPARAWKTWHSAFHLVPHLPEALLARREREYID